MTSAHKPTFHPAIGSAHPGGYRIIAPSQRVPTRSLPSHLTLKVRKSTQEIPNESSQDLKAELVIREREHRAKQEAEQRRKGLTHSLDSDQEIKFQLIEKDLEKYHDSDDSGNERNSDDNEDEDEEAELIKELTRIKKERAEEEKKKQLEEAEREAKTRTEAILKGNPLLSSSTPSFTIKRRWDDDVVFKNQSREEPIQKKRFINDMIRSDFHKKFLSKYIT